MRSLRACVNRHEVVGSVSVFVSTLTNSLLDRGKLSYTHISASTGGGWVSKAFGDLAPKFQAKHGCRQKCRSYTPMFLGIDCASAKSARRIMLLNLFILVFFCRYLVTVD